MHICLLEELHMVAIAQRLSYKGHGLVKGSGWFIEVFVFVREVMSDLM